MFEKNMHQLEEMRSRVNGGGGGEESKEIKKVREAKEVKDDLGVGYVEEEIIGGDGN